MSKMAILPPMVSDDNDSKSRNSTGKKNTSTRRGRSPAAPSRRQNYHPNPAKFTKGGRRESFGSDHDDCTESSYTEDCDDFSSSSSGVEMGHFIWKRVPRNTRSPHPPTRRVQAYPTAPRTPKKEGVKASIGNHTNTIPACPRTPNKNTKSSAPRTPKKDGSKSPKSPYLHSYKKPVMPARSMYLAMDCEMVSTVRHDSVCARVVLVDWKGRSVLDSYVKPDDVVTDYKTFVSGITADDLADAPSFATVRQQVRELLQGKILVGHGLENDLRALQLEHPWWLIRDTAYYHPFMQDRTATGMCWTPRKLRDLVHEKLHRTDFQSTGSAHCPAEDAKAALDLYKSHRPRWEACMMQEMKKNPLVATATPSSVVLTQMVLMPSPMASPVVYVSPMPSSMAAPPVSVALPSLPF